MNRMAFRRRRPGLALGVLALIALASLVAAAPAEAQMLHLFACKVVCGYQPGNVRLLNDTGPIPFPHPPEDLKPGNYATTCNIFNYDLSAAAQPVFPYLAIEGGGLIFLGAVNVGVLNANAYGCRDIAASLPAPPPLIYEGYLTLFTLDPDFKVDSVHTFESQNAFERHLLWQYDPLGPFGIVFQSLGLSLPRITAPLAGGGVLARNFATGSGAGGLGLGASIDVEDVRRIDIDLTPLTPVERDRVPPEVRDAVDASGTG
jgi:hypothetical protein